MPAVRNRKAAVVAVAACAILVLTCIMGWFAGRFIPGSPEIKELSDGPSYMPAAVLSDAATYEPAYIDAGSPAELSGIAISEGSIEDNDLIQGRFIQFLGPDCWQVLKSDDSWEAVIPDFTLQVKDAKVVSGQTIEEWYPHLSDLPDALYGYGECKTRFAVVEFDMTNRSEEDFGLFIPWLWGEGLLPEDGAGVLGMSVDKYVLEELYGTPQNSPDTKEYELEDGWSTVSPGETRTFMLIYPLYRTMFATEDDFENADASRLYLQIPDSGTKTIYRFRLG